MRRSAKSLPVPPAASTTRAKWSGSSAQALIFAAGTLSKCAGSIVENAVPRPSRPLPSNSMLRTPRRASSAANIVPEKPPPTIATAVRRSDLIVGPLLGVGRARLPADHMVVQLHHRPPGGLGEPARHDRMDRAGHARRDHRPRDPHRAQSMLEPGHSERARMVVKQAPREALLDGLRH